MIYDTSHGEIYIFGSDGSRTTPNMGGWVAEEFAIGFNIPLGAESYTLYWPGNSPIDLHIEGD
jgi:hypothetical protein